MKINDCIKLVETELPPSSWLTITQDRINTFANATNDHQFIHVDEKRAKETPFGSTIAHGYLTLSLLSDLLSHCWPKIDGLVMGINYGSNKIRYLSPVKVGQNIRATARFIEIGEKRPGQWLITTSVTVEIKEETTPALIAEILSLFIVED